MSNWEQIWFEDRSPLSNYINSKHVVNLSASNPMIYRPNITFIITFTKELRGIKYQSSITNEIWFISPIPQQEFVYLNYREKNKSVFLDAPCHFIDHGSPQLTIICSCSNFCPHTIILNPCSAIHLYNLVK